MSYTLKDESVKGIVESLTQLVAEREKDIEKRLGPKPHWPPEMGAFDRKDVEEIKQGIKQIQEAPTDETVVKVYTRLYRDIQHFCSFVHMHVKDRIDRKQLYGEVQLQAEDWTTEEDKDDWDA